MCGGRACLAMAHVFVRTHPSFILLRPFASIQMVRTLFKVAAYYQPTIIFIDEVLLCCFREGTAREECAMSYSITITNTLLPLCCRWTRSSASAPRTRTRPRGGLRPSSSCSSTAAAARPRCVSVHGQAGKRCDESLTRLYPLLN